MGCAERMSREEQNFDAPAISEVSRGRTNLDWRSAMGKVTHPAKKIYTVYALIDPRISSDPSPSAVRYIGITYNIYQRMRQHSRCEGLNERKNAWIRGLQEDQIMFTMYSIEKVDTYEKALEREVYWIEYYTKRSAQLLNIAGMPTEEKKLTAKIKEVNGTVVDIRKLLFYTSDRRVVCVDDATNEEYDQFIRSQIPVTGDSKWWPSHMRRDSICHAIEQGVQIKLYVRNTTPPDGAA